MATKRIKADQLGNEIDKILKEYGDDVEFYMKEVTLKIGRKGATAVKNEAHDKFNGNKYYKSWTASEVKWPHYSSVVIYNRKLYQLPHLLEHGHALVHGGRNVGSVDGRPHIAPVEEKLIEEYYNTVVAGLSL